MDFTIRLAGADDLSSLVALVGGFRDHLGRSKPSDSVLAKTIPCMLTSSDAQFLVAETETLSCIGYALIRYRYSMWLGRAEAFLEDLFVVSAARRSGVGHALAERAIADAEAKGCAEINLDTYETNSAAIRLYERLGFTNSIGETYGRQLWFERRLEPTQTDAKSDAGGAARGARRFRRRG